jgi:hypothetical protein
MQIVGSASRIVLSAAALVLWLGGVLADDDILYERDTPYVPTPQDVVERMLDMANVKPGEYLIDLGSGDGRIVVTAAQRGVRAYGVDLNPQRVKEAPDAARRAARHPRLPHGRRLVAGRHRQCAQPYPVLLGDPGQGGGTLAGHE